MGILDSLLLLPFPAITREGVLLAHFTPDMADFPPIFKI